MTGGSDEQQEGPSFNIHPAAAPSLLAKILSRYFQLSLVKKC